MLTWGIELVVVGHWIHVCRKLRSVQGIMFIDWIRITLKFWHSVVTGVTVYLNSTVTRCRLVVIGIRCRRFAGRAVGVGSSEILGRSTTRVRLGAMQFKSDFSVLENTRIDFIIGLDILRKYQCVVCLRENVVKLHYQNKVFRVPIMLPSNPMSYDTESNVESVSADNSDTFYDTGIKSFHYEDEDSEDIGIYESVSMEGW